MDFHLHLLLRANTRKYSTINHLQFTFCFIYSDQSAAARDSCDSWICRLGLDGSTRLCTDEMHDDVIIKEIMHLLEFDKDLM
jgi:hypothetical protein